jgi:hypothetical protein
MARSRKKTPGWCDRNPWAKRQANKRVRRYKGDLPRKGNVHHKLYDPWNICDWKSLYFTKLSLEEWYGDRVWKAWSK